MALFLESAVYTFGHDLSSSQVRELLWLEAWGILEKEGAYNLEDVLLIWVFLVHDKFIIEYDF